MTRRRPDPDEALVDEIVGLTRQTGLRMRRRMAATGLPFGQTSCLFTLAKTGEIPATRLATEMGIRAPTMTGLLDTLEASELVRRRPSPDDRRVTLLSFTPKGRRLLQRVQRDVYEEWSGLLAEVPAARKRAWTDTLHEIRSLGQRALHAEARP
ncbi:MAG TPA: MarR family transcriptional regulator [Thermoplasmata archaeon]|nr:MarR family transcriptional regulator [Thermoplasmata archaeon]